MSHLTYAEAIITGIVQGVSELFPVSSLGHNVLIPALIGGQWAKDLSVTAKDSPYLAFIVGLHVATALAMIAYFWRDWVRIVRGFFTSIRDRRVADPDQRLAWMIIGGTIPVGIVGLVLQKVVTSVFAKPTLTAVFLAINGGILLYSERQRRLSAAPAGAYPDNRGGYPGDRGDDGGWDDGQRESRGRRRDDYPDYPGDSGGYRDDRGYPGGHDRTQVWNQQPGQQQWQGPDPRYGEQDPWGDAPQQPSFTPAPQQPQQPQQPSPRAPMGGQEPPAPQVPTFTPAGPGQGSGAGEPPRSVPDNRGSHDAGRAPREGDRDDRRGFGWDDPRGRRQARELEDAGQDFGPRRGPGARRGFDDERDFGRRQDRQADRLPGDENDERVAADRRLATMTFKQAVLVGAWQIAALLPGISRDGIVTVGGMRTGLRREDAVRYSFLLSAPVILAAGVLKLGDLTGPEGKGILGPVVIGSLLAFVGAYFSVRFLTRYFSESKSLKPFGIYCLAAGILSFLILTVVR